MTTLTKIATNYKAPHIYGAYLTLPDGSQPLYIGASNEGIDGRSPTYNHRKNEQTMLGALTRANPMCPLTIFTLQEFDQPVDEQELHDLERRWISYFKNMGVRILNKMCKPCKTNDNAPKSKEANICRDPRSGSYGFRFYINGTRYYRTFGSMEEAEEAKRQYLQWNTYHLIDN